MKTGNRQQSSTGDIGAQGKWKANEVRQLGPLLSTGTAGQARLKLSDQPQPSCALAAPPPTPSPALHASHCALSGSQAPNCAPSV